MDRREKLKESFLNGLRTVGDLMVLNWLWFFCSVPIITIGPATCALYAVTLKLARGEHASPFRDFFRAFRENFKKGLVLGLIAIALAVVAWVDFGFAMGQTGPLHTVYLALAIVLAGVLLSYVCYAFSLQAMFENTLMGQIKNAFAMVFVAPGKTIMMWFITLFPLLALLLPKVVISMLGFLYLIAGFSGPAYLNSRLLRDVFDKINGAPIRPRPEDEEG